MDIDKRILDQKFFYIDGLLKRKIDSAKGGFLKGSIAGYVGKDGYRRINVSGKTMLCHRAIFLMNNGYLPKYIDHINGNRDDNRIENLREATKHENNRNSKLSKNNTSGFKGVSFHKASMKWMVRILVEGKYRSFGYYDDLKTAHEVAIEARNKYHGNFAKHQ